MKKYAPFLLALATGAVLAGCSGQKTAETTAPSEAVESSAASASETSESAESASESESQESAETTDSRRYCPRRLFERTDLYGSCSSDG